MSFIKELVTSPPLKLADDCEGRSRIGGARVGGQNTGLNRKMWRPAFKRVLQFALGKFGIDPWASTGWLKDLVWLGPPQPFVCVVEQHWLCVTDPSGAEP